MTETELATISLLFVKETGITLVII